MTLLGNIPFASHAHILMCFDPYEIENVKQKNSSKCSYLICCRGQVQRPFPSDSLAVRRILVLLMPSNEHRQLGQCIVNLSSKTFDIFLHCDILLNGSVVGRCCLVGNTQKGFYHHMSPLTWPEFYLEPRHAMQIIGMDILLEGRGRAKSALILFKRLRVREMGGTSNGPKIRNEISATFRHLNLPCQNAAKVVTPRREL